MGKTSSDKDPGGTRHSASTGMGHGVAIQEGVWLH
jgi:hypothetical protein